MNGTSGSQARRATEIETQSDDDKGMTRKPVRMAGARAAGNPQAKQVYAAATTNPPAAKATPQSTSNPIHPQGLLLQVRRGG
jgi:hypothetical protein